MKFTDIFIRRPVLASVVSLLILVLGLRALGTLQVLQYPQTQNAVVTINTVYYGADPRRGRRLHHHAAGERHRAGQRHRLHDLDQHVGRQHDHGLSPAELRCRQGADRDQHQDQLGAEPASHRHAAADADGQGRPDHRRDVYRLQQQRAGAEPDHRLHRARGAAEAAGGARRADGRDPRAASISRCAPGSIRTSWPPTA